MSTTLEIFRLITMDWQGIEEQRKKRQLNKLKEQAHKSGKKASIQISWRLLILFLCVAAWAYSEWQIHTPRISKQYNYEVNSDPTQESTKEKTFSFFYKAHEYTVEPLYDYTLNGLVVSMNEFEGSRGFVHSLWEDDLNVADLCVVWGKNVNAEILNAFNFSNGSFTCYFSTNNSQLFNQFNQEKLSNNHLLAVNEDIREKLVKLKIGDQIQIQGWLSKYSHSGGFKRGTSTTRTDKGDGACETIYVNSVNVLSRGNSKWIQVSYLSTLAIAGLILLFFAKILLQRFSSKPM
ncbi:MAG: hypothetical protein KDD50_03415 [Bdellovibrionales bacterium]|nr:hypothetical protein [Bdellovibrionales bacterium]